MTVLIRVSLILLSPPSGRLHCLLSYTIVMALGQSQPFQSLCLQITQHNSLHVQELFYYGLRTDNGLYVSVIKLKCIVNFHPSG